MRNERLLIIVLIFCWALSMAAQQMEVHDFKHQKRYIWNRSKVAVDKQRALLDLYTTEKGFTFFANGKEAAEAEEGDGLITVKLPNKTRYVTIKHDTYGQLTWRVPKKYLKRKKHYCATLLTSDPTKKYQLKNQWVTLTISPENAVAQIDSVMQLVRDGKVALFLPVGKHRYEVQSPYYEAVCDSFVLTDTAKVELAINLQPVYAYVVVKTPWNSGKIYVDGQQIGKGQAQSGRLADGEHRLAVFLSDYCIYDKPFQIGRAEKKLIELTYQDYKFVGRRVTKALPSLSATEKGEEKQVVTQIVSSTSKQEMCAVTLVADSTNTEIWLDREHVANGRWSGQLALGYHLVSTVKDSIESKPTELWIIDTTPQELNLAVPQTSKALINIHGNVTDADIFINNVRVGRTPLVIPSLTADKQYTVSLRKSGYKDASATVVPRGNELTEVNIKMKKK